MTRRNRGFLDDATYRGRTRDIGQPYQGPLSRQLDPSVLAGIAHEIDRVREQVEGLMVEVHRQQAEREAVRAAFNARLRSNRPVGGGVA